MNKTNAMRELERAGIRFETVTYEYDEENLSGVHAAAQIERIASEQCFKTLVARGERCGLLVFCIPVARELDLKRAAAAAGDKKAELVHVKELQALTGYIRGGCSPVGMKKHFPTFIDESAASFGEIGVSAGRRGMFVIVEPHALADFVGAAFVPLTMAALGK